jgi:hypothetical protein
VPNGGGETDGTARTGEGAERDEDVADGSAAATVPDVTRRLGGGRDDGSGGTNGAEGAGERTGRDERVDGDSAAATTSDPKRRFSGGRDDGSEEDV